MRAAAEPFSRKRVSRWRRVDVHSIRAIVVAAMAGLVVAPWVSNPIGNDPRSPALGVSFASQKKGISERKDRDENVRGASFDSEAIGSAEPMTTLGTLVNLHHNEIVPLSDTEPTAEVWACFLRDRVTGQVGRMDGRLLGLVRGVSNVLAQRQREQGEGEPLHSTKSAMQSSMKNVMKLMDNKRENGVQSNAINGSIGKSVDTEPMRFEFVSGYRYWKFNEMLRKKGRNVASESQHTAAKAIDFRVQGVDTLILRDAVDALEWTGGMGYYPGKSDRFVHVDTGAKRRWKGK